MKPEGTAVLSHGPSLQTVLARSRWAEPVLGVLRRKSHSLSRAGAWAREASEVAVRYYGGKTDQTDSEAEPCRASCHHGRAQLPRGREDPEKNGSEGQHDRRATGILKGLMRCNHGGSYSECSSENS